jgi:hypothetical protein
MERKEKKERRRGLLPRPEGWIKPTKENFFDLYKPSSTTEVLLESGVVVTSEEILKIVKEFKQFMERKNVDRLWNWFNNDPEIYALTHDEFIMLENTVITEKGLTVFNVIVDIDTLVHP